jgi:hypothetical protein
MESAQNNIATPLPGEQISCCLTELECAMAEWQCALLKRHVAELEKCTARQRELCRQLGDLVIKRGHIDLIPANSDCCATAARVREQGRRFAAILRRMRKNVETLQRAMRGPAGLYHPPRSSAVPMEF